MKKTSLASAATVLALVFPLAALGDISGTGTLSAGGNFNFDNGTNVSSGGDISFTGSNITFVGSAKGGAFPGLTGSTDYASVNSAVAQAAGGIVTATPIPTSGLSAGSASGSILIIKTNGGNYAKALVTALSSTSISFQYTTYESATTGGGPAVPTVTDILNNSSLIPNGFPNSGIAPSTLFVIHGTGMASATTVTSLQNPSTGLPTTLNGATVSISAGGKTYNPGLYYAEATQIAGVLPAAVPVGSATLTVSYNGGTSTPLTFQVVQSAYGIDTYDGNLAVLQDALSAQLISYTSSGKANQIVLVWGTGLGADPGDSDTTQTGSPHTINTPVQIYVGGVQVPASSIAYVGASVYPGVHIIQFTLPAGVPNGCFVPLAIITGTGTVSNIATIPYMDGGGVCSDSYYGISGGTISTISGSTNTSEGFVAVEQLTLPSVTGSGTTTQDIATASFEQISGTYSFTGSSSSEVSIGGCIVDELITSTGSVTSTLTETGLNAGTVTVTPPGASPITLQGIAEVPGIYDASLPANAIPSAGGTFVFNWTGGSGANSVGAGSASVNFISPLTWTNQSASATVTRSAGQTYNWTGGTPGTFVVVTGNAFSLSTGATGGYTCIASASAGTITVPAYITASLPAGSGSSTIENSSAISTFTASGLNVGIAFGGVVVSVNTTWQ